MKTFFRKIKEIILGFISLLIGMKVTIKNYFAKSVTIDYPLKKQPMTANFRGMVDLKPEACVICYQCIKICPVAALYLSHNQIVGPDNKKKLEIKKFTYNAELCCFCGLCDEICPTDAMFMNKVFEASAYSHNQLVNIDLMNPQKYTHLDHNYNFAEEAKFDSLNTVGKIVKPAPGPQPTVVPPVTPAPSTPPEKPLADSSTERNEAQP